MFTDMHEYESKNYMIFSSSKVGIWLVMTLVKVNDCIILRFCLIQVRYRNYQYCHPEFSRFLVSRIIGWNKTINWLAWEWFSSKLFFCFWFFLFLEGFFLLKAVFLLLDLRETHKTNLGLPLCLKPSKNLLVGGGCQWKFVRFLTKSNQINIWLSIT